MTVLPPIRHRASQRGLTLIELMISVTLGLIIVAAMTYLYINSRGAYRTNQGAAQIQDAGRFAVDSISRDVRRAGSLGCATANSIAAASTPVSFSTIALGPGAAFNPAAGSVSGLRAVSPGSNVFPATPPAGFSATGVNYYAGDVLTLWTAAGPPVSVVSPDPAASVVNVADPGGIGAGDLALISNCRQATLFRVTSATGTGPSALAFGSASNSSPDLTGAMQPVYSSGEPGTTVQRYDQVTYFVGVNPALPAAVRRPALYRCSLDTGCDAVADNVENMDIVYGVGTPVTVGGVTTLAAPTFQHADAMAGNWQNVVSIRVALVAVGSDPGGANSRQTLMFGDSAAGAPVAWTAPDTRLRQVFTVTAALRGLVQ